jgi:hypothetical protein
MSSGAGTSSCFGGSSKNNPLGVSVIFSFLSVGR